MRSARKFRPNTFDLVACLAVILFPIAFIYFRLGLRSLDVPPVYDGDTPWMFLSMKNILQFGWPTTNPTLGFPFGSDAALEPIYPTDTVLLVQMLSFLTSDPIVASNLFVYLTHVVNAAIVFACFRALCLGRVMSLIGAMSFAFLEFGIHPGRVYNHQTLTLFGALAIAGTLSLLPFRHARPWPRWVIVASCLGAVVVGLSHPYYVAFSAMVILISAVVLLAGKRIKDVSFAVAMLLVIAVVMAAAWFGPTVLADNIVPYSGPDRFWDSQSLLGLRVPDLVMPPRSYSTWLQNARDAYYEVKGGTFDTYLGLIGAFGAIVAVLLALRIPVLRARSAEESETIWAASLLALFCLAFGMTNGLGLLFSMTVTSMLRGQDRIIPLLAFYCIYIGLCSIEIWKNSIHSRGTRLGLTGFVLGAACVGLFDQTSGLSYAALQSAVSPLYQSDRQFYAELERALPVKTAVLQLPAMYFPEDGTYVPTGLGVYDELKGPTYTNGLRWSFGLSSENEGYLSQLDKDALNTVAQAIVRGFGAVLIYKDGYGDRGAALTQRIADLLDSKPLLEASRYIVFPLPSRPIERMERGQVVVLWRGLGIAHYINDINGRTFRWDDSADGTVTIYVSNRKDHAAKMRLSGFLVPALDGEYRGTLSVDDSSANFIAARPGVDLSREIVLAPGRHRITIHVEVPTYKPPLLGRRLHFRLIEPSLTDVAEIEDMAAVANALIQGRDQARARP